MEQTQPRAFSSQSMYFTTVDDGSTYAEQLFDHVPSEAPDIAGVVEHWRIGGIDYFLVS